MRETAFVIVFMAGLAEARAVQWPLETLTGGNLATPMVGDLDGDGVPEVVCASNDGNVYCLRPDGSRKWQLRIATLNALSTSPSLADFDGVPTTLEVAVFGGQTLYIIDASGSTLASLLLPAAPALLSGPTVLDAQNDGVPEVYYAGMTANGAFLFRIDAARSGGQLTLSQAWAQPLDREYAYAPTVAVDIDGDGQFELIGSSVSSAMDTPGTVKCFRADGAVAWRIDMWRCLYLRVIATDLDGNGTPEVVVNQADAALRCFRGLDGSPLWSFPALANNRCFAAGDIDGDGRREIIVGATTFNGTSGYRSLVQCIGHTGLLKWETLVPECYLSNANASPVIGDLDNDGSSEVILTGAGWQDYMTFPYVQVPSSLTVLGPTGAIQAHLRTPDVRHFGGSPAIADLDGDGRLEFLYCDYDRGFGVRAQDLSSPFAYAGRRGPPTAAARWPHFRGELGGTGARPIITTWAAPQVPLSLQQVDGLGNPVAAGASGQEAPTVARAQLRSTEAAAAVRLEVEVKPVGWGLDGTNIISSDPVSPGAVAALAFGDLGSGPWEWRARTKNLFGGRASAWVSFGAGDGAADFIVEAREKGKLAFLPTSCSAGGAGWMPLLLLLLLALLPYFASRSCSAAR